MTEHLFGSFLYAYKIGEISEEKCKRLIRLLLDPRETSENSKE